MVKLDKTQVKVRQFVTKTFLEKGFVPTSEEIGHYMNLGKVETENTLRSLAESKALVLHPHKCEVWLAHPFSASPNAFWVQSLKSKIGWWSNCIWCAMGIAALSKEDVKLTSRWGGEGDIFDVEIKNGIISNSDFVVHMALPVARLWDNVIHSCSLQLPFKSEEAVDEWCHRHRISKGSVISAEKCYELSSKWYGPYLDVNWNRKSPEEAKEFFDSIGLDLNFKPI
ncbi:MAG: hypothetical protein JNM24_19975 [Bdellovibrionaceae bacterium]|nr:hypothetical protein [Pseudobdellovibrionaceae bacterium]